MEKEKKAKKSLKWLWISLAIAVVALIATWCLISINWYIYRNCVRLFAW